MGGGEKNLKGDLKKTREISYCVSASLNRVPKKKRVLRLRLLKETSARLGKGGEGAQKKLVSSGKKKRLRANLRGGGGGSRTDIVISKAFSSKEELDCKETKKGWKERNLLLPWKKKRSRSWRGWKKNMRLENEFGLERGGRELLHRKNISEGSPKGKKPRHQGRGKKNWEFQTAQKFH